MNATGCAVLYDCENDSRVACTRLCQRQVCGDRLCGGRGAINVLLHSDACNTGVDICTYGFAVRADIGRYCTGLCAVIHTYLVTPPISLHVDLHGTCT